MNKIVRPLVVSAAVAASTLAHANLVVNGGFETGALNPEWTEIPASGANFYVTSEEAFEGTYSMKFANPLGYLDTIEQLIPDTEVGQTYRIEMWVKNYGVGNDALVIEYSGDTVAYLSPVATALESWEHVSFEHTVLGTSDKFRIRGHDAAFFYVDNVSVTPVPEPVSGIALGIGALGLLIRRRMKRPS